MILHRPDPPILERVWLCQTTGIYGVYKDVTIPNWTLHLAMYVLRRKWHPKGEVIAPMSPSGASLAGPNVLGNGMSGLVGPDVPGKGTSGHCCQHSVDCAGMLARLQIA